MLRFFAVHKWRQSWALCGLPAVDFQPSTVNFRMSIRFEVYVQPRASKTAVAGMHDGRLKIRLAAPPVDGAANAELVRFVAECLGVPKSEVRLVAGDSSRRKLLEVPGTDAAAVMERLKAKS
jgi:uncharacterized protein (TIGR00251 family)